MKTQDEKKFRLLPSYSYIPFIAIAVIHMTVYLGTKLINHNMPHHDLTTVVDELVPLAPEWALIYVLTFLFWVGGLAFAAWQERELCFRLFTAAGISYIICAVCFIVLPTEIVRPEITGDGYCERLLAALYTADVPTNIFPSMHCMMSYLVLRGIMLSPMSKSPWWSVAAAVLTLLICASTLFVKQHFFLDVVSALVFGEISVQLALRTNAWRLLDAMDKKILQRDK